MVDPVSGAVILPDPIPFGKYYLLERVNTGGMAEVYKAKAFGVEGFERLVAVKKILPSIAANTEFIRMLIDEAKLAGQLTHANIAQIFDLGRVDDAYYIAMEYVSGRDLKVVWERCRDLQVALPIEIICHFMMKVCDGLDYAHDKRDPLGEPLNIVHRDVSPQNVLISYEGDVKLIDFGVAKAANSTTETRVGILKGKLSYMSPEQVRGLALDRRSDTFAAGIVLYELVTGERLFLGESDFETLEKIRKVEVAPPTLFNPSIPPQLEDIILKALDKNPNHRFQSAHDLQHELQRFMFDNQLRCTGRDVSAFMNHIFEREIAEERAKLEYFQSLSIQPAHEVPDVLVQKADLSWDDDESETHVFSAEMGSAPRKSPPPPTPSWGRSSGASAAPRAQSTGSSPRVAAASGAQPVVDITTIAGPPVPGPEPSAFAAPTPRETSKPKRASDPKPSAAKSKATGNRTKKSTSAPPRIPTKETPPARQPEPLVREVEPRRTSVTTMLTAAIVIVVFIGIGLLIYNATRGDDAPTGIRLALTPEGTEVTVLIDDAIVHQGTIPHVITNVAPGSRRVEVRADGFDTIRDTVVVQDDQQFVLNGRLNAVEYATLAVSSTPPGARVSIDGEPRGSTPTTLDELRVGSTITLTLEAPGAVAHETQMVVSQGMQPIRVALRPEGEAAGPDTVAVALRSTPANAAWAIRDGEGTLVGRGTAPGQIPNLQTGRAYTVTFGLDGYEESTFVFTPSNEPEQTIERTLVASAPAPVEPEVVAATQEDVATPPVRTETTRDRDEERVAARNTEPAQGERDPTRDAREAREARAEPDPPRERDPAPPRERDPEPPRERDPTPPPTDTRTEPAAAAAGPPGFLNIQSRPAARVFVNGVDTGRMTPVLRMEVPPGPHRVQLVNEEFGLDRTFRVNVDSGRERNVIHREE